MSNPRELYSEYFLNTRFPHNYVGTTFKPLPGIHEMAAKIRERREKLDAAQDRQGRLKSLDGNTTSSEGLKLLAFLA